MTEKPFYSQEEAKKLQVGAAAILRGDYGTAAALVGKQAYEYVLLAMGAPILTDENGICSFGCKHMTIRVIKPQDCISWATPVTKSVAFANPQ